MSAGARASLALRASHGLGAAVLAVHLAAAACVLLAWPGFPGLAVALLLLALGGLVTRRVALLRGNAAPALLELSPPDGLRVVLRDGSCAAVADSLPRHVTRYWVVLPLAGGRARHLLITADMLAEDDFRRLRVWALWGRGSGAMPASPA